MIEHQRKVGRLSLKQRENKLLFTSLQGYMMAKLHHFIEAEKTAKGIPIRVT